VLDHENAMDADALAARPDAVATAAALRRWRDLDRIIREDQRECRRRSREGNPMPTSGPEFDERARQLTAAGDEMRRLQSQLLRAGEPETVARVRRERRQSARFARDLAFFDALDLDLGGMPPARGRYVPTCLRMRSRPRERRPTTRRTSRRGAPSRLSGDDDDPDPDRVAEGVAA
jgi:hypothetical protein